MKIRSGFVSNSSSSSFICDVCDEEFLGWDASPSDYDHFTCEFEHICCNDNIIEAKGFDKVDYGYVPSRYCPICNFKFISNRDVCKYLEKSKGITRDEVFAEIKKLNKRRRVLKDFEYVQYVGIKFGLTEKNLLEEIKERFGKYDKFMKYLE